MSIINHKRVIYKEGIMPTVLETVYSKISQIVEEVKQEFEYSNKSKAFAHIMMKMIFGLSDQDAQETITDDYKDNGIDAIYYEEIEAEKVRMHFFQFKFPESFGTVKSGFSEAETNKLVVGYERFISPEFNSKIWNNFLIDKRNEYLQFSDFETNLYLVRYTNSNDNEVLTKFNENCKILRDKYFNDIKSHVLKAKDIIDLYDTNYSLKYPDFSLIHKGSVQNYEFDSRYKIQSFAMRIVDLYESIKPIHDSVFEGNVRFYDKTTTVNQNIRNTLETEPENFILFNNGITILCEKASIHSGRSSCDITKGSIINGAQTVGSVFDLFSQYKPAEIEEKFKNALVIVKVINIRSDDSSINEIVFALNSQTKMFNAYSISTNSLLKDLQNEINNTTDYFFELKYNEFDYLKGQGKINKYSKNRFTSERIIQCFTAYYDKENKAYLAKLSKGELFRDEKYLERVITQLTKATIIESYETFKSISEIITSYRRYRKNPKKLDILTRINTDVSSIDKFQYLNTGDFLILFATGLYKRKFNVDADVAILTSIEIIANEIIPKYGKKLISNTTKSNQTFSDTRTFINALTVEYNKE